MRGKVHDAITAQRRTCGELTIGIEVEFERDGSRWRGSSDRLGFYSGIGEPRKLGFPFGERAFQNFGIVKRRRAAGCAEPFVGGFEDRIREHGNASARRRTTSGDSFTKNSKRGCGWQTHNLLRSQQRFTCLRIWQR